MAALLCALWASCSSLSVRARTNLELFDCYWGALDLGYPFFGSKHIDWKGLGAQYRSAIVFAEGPTEIYHLLAGMFSELQDLHVSLEIPEANWHAGGADVVSLTDAPGFSYAIIERRMFVQSWPAGEAPVPPDHLDADAAAWPEVVQVEGYPLVWSLVDVLWRGPPESPCELRLRWSDGTLSRHVVHRPPAGRALVAGSVDGMQVTVRVIKPTLDRVVAVERSGRWARLRVDTLSADDLGVERKEFVERLDKALDEAAQSDGLILDLRRNRGGDGTVTFMLAGRFLAEPYETVLACERTEYLFGLLQWSTYGQVEWTPRPPRIDRPLVVLTSWRTGSAAEHLARMLQRTCAAVVIGERTAGAEAFLEKVDGPDGSTLRFGKGRAMEITGRGLQDDGVIPDVAVRLSIDDVRRCGSLGAAQHEWDERLLRAADRALQQRAGAK